MLNGSVLSEEATRKLMEIVDKVKVQGESMNVEELILVLEKIDYFRFKHETRRRPASIRDMFKRRLNMVRDLWRSNMDILRAFEGDNLPPRRPRGHPSWSAFYARDTLRVCRTHITNEFKRGTLYVNT